MLAEVDAPPRHGYVPVEPDPDSEPWWSALAEGRLLLATCRSCGRRWAPPSGHCPHCGSAGHDWTEHDGRGRVYSWIVVRRPLDEAFADDAPYVVAVVTLDDADGARLVGRVLQPAPERVEADLPVQLVTYRVREQALPGFVAVSETA